MKGVLAVPEDQNRFIFNGVRSTIDVKPGKLWADDPRFCRIVFIGRGLDRDSLQSQFTKCMASA
tara:strand:- start:624 stop:815 length:192 start_codon:yes stop_codon:yes gene_type:complete